MEEVVKRDGTTSNLQHPVNLSCRAEEMLCDCECWADVLAVCYRHILEVFNEESLLIRRFFPDGGDCACSNPNEAELERIVACVRDIVFRELSGLPGSTQREQIGELSRVLDSAKLVPHGEPAENRCTPFFAALLGIDEAYQCYDEVDFSDVPGPLNMLCRDEIGVYRAGRDYLSYLLESHGVRGIPRAGVNDCLSVFRLIRMPFRAGKLPRITRLSPRKSPPAIANTNRLVIGFVPFSSVNPLSEDSMLLRVQSVGEGYSVDYAPGYERCYETEVNAIVKAASESHCNILVFPEYVMSPALLHVLSAAIAKYNVRGELLLTVAGSGWESDEGNVCHLLDAWGSDVGTYHKVVPYETEPAYDEMGGVMISGWVEDLPRPGASCTIAEIPGFGYVLPSICKDFAVEGSSTLAMARCFHPQVICCPAMSPSLKQAFWIPSEQTAKRILSMVCLSNHCGVRPWAEGFDGSISLVAAPGFDSTWAWDDRRSEAKLEYEFVKRDSMCFEGSARCAACLFVATIDYNRTADDAEGTICPKISVSGPVFAKS